MRHQDRWDSFNTDWEDCVAPIDENLYWSAAEREAFVDDIKDLASAVVECTMAPLQGLINDLPRTMAYDSREWHDAWRSARRGWRRWNHV